MRATLSILFVGACLEMVICFGVAADNKPATNQLGVVIKSIRSFHNRAEFDLEVQSHSADKLFVSRFSLATAVRTVKLSDTNGRVWIVVRPRNIEDPPSRVMDFTFLIKPTSTNRITIATPRLALVTATIQRSPSSATDKPKQIHYEVARDVGTLTAAKDTYNWVLCTGVGNSQIEWLSGPEP